MYVGFMLHVIQQFTGINIIMQFGPSILQDAGFGGGSHQALLLSMVFLSSVNALGNSLGVALSGKYGRREMMLKSTIPMGVALLIMASAMIASSLIGGDLLKECKSPLLKFNQCLVGSALQAYQLTSSLLPSDSPPNPGPFVQRFSQ